jgi:HK97 gp10 family phage protein
MSAGFKAVYRSHLNDVVRDIRRAERKRVLAAAKHVRSAVRDKVNGMATSSPGEPPGKQSGRLRKGIAYAVQDADTALVGFRAPAHHAHLLEFGTRDRIVAKTGASSGHVAPRPFFVPTLREEAPAVRRIFAEPWTDYV